MTANHQNHQFDLVLERIIDAPREKVFRCWSDPKLLEQWFAPKPWTIRDAEIDMRPGGASKFTMHGPEGEVFPASGVYLEVVENEKIVTTDAYSAGWVPAEKPFFTAIVTFEDAGGGKTKYTARARHWRAEDKEEHEKMGFHEGWGQCATQLEELAKTL
ncbi:MAG: SRPBCC family protein [Rhizobiaceae bacterium]